jgi:hypothetical protein
VRNRRNLKKHAHEFILQSNPLEGRCASGEGRPVKPTNWVGPRLSIHRPKPGSNPRFERYAFTDEARMPTEVNLIYVGS